MRDFLQKDGIDTIAKGDDVIEALLPRLPETLRETYAKRFAAIPRTFSGSAEQDEILGDFRSLRDEIQQILETKK